jgi:hypothetical protein
MNESLPQGKLESGWSLSLDRSGMVLFHPWESYASSPRY